MMRKHNMNKRKVTFNEKVEEKKFKRDEPKPSRFKGGHSLDSDDEDESKGTLAEQVGDVLHEDDIEGQEEETIRNDEGIAVTPFNLKDEMEEGHFDAQGNYVAHENEEDIKDEWLDSVDWNKVKDITSKVTDEEMDKDLPMLNTSDVKSEMIKYMKPGENVLKAIRRLGGNKKAVSSADRWKKKKQQAEPEVVDEATKLNKENLLKLTGHADELLQNGDFQIYEKTFEKLQYEIKNCEPNQFDDIEEKKEHENEAGSDDDELEAAFRKAKSTVENDDNKDNNKDNIKKEDKKSVPIVEEEVMWMYKMSEKEAAKLLGPFKNSQMLKWQEENYFATGVYCRKTDSEGCFYNSRRIDFDLYS